ncbi:DNA polymerase III, subunit gamma and tau [Pleurocapsa sp. CCALA 161]|nr:DNA polymerase III, subunit gamma and tau [Pleurocapsa sp. CCALA 161]
MSLAVEYRPIRFDQIVGQSVAVNIAVASLNQPQIHTTYILVGSSGSGKTTLARIIARAINCKQRDGFEPCNQCDSCQAHLRNQHLDINEIDGADRNGVDDVREIIEQCKLNTVVSKYRVYIIDEAHQMSKPAQNALLKILEEPPRNTIFLLCTTEEDKLLETIRSRARILRFNTVNRDLVIGYLNSVAYNEKIPLTEEEANRIYDYNKGSIRQCLQTLGTISPQVTVADLCPQISLHEIQNLFLALEMRDYLAINSIVQRVIDQGFYPKQLLISLVDTAINMMTMPDIKPEFIFNLNRVLEVILPDVNRLGTSSNAVTNCRLALYEAVTVWQSNKENTAENPIRDELIHNHHQATNTPLQTDFRQVPTPQPQIHSQVQLPTPVSQPVHQPLAFQTSHRISQIAQGACI